jgi:hypothetical protein
MKYMEMLNCVAYENAMIKMASGMQKKAVKGDAGPAETAGKKVDEKVEEGKEKVSEGWDAFTDWAGKNQQGLWGAGTAAVTAPAIHAGLNQIPWFKQRRLLNYMLSGFGAGAAGLAGATWGPDLFASKDAKKDDKAPAKDAKTPEKKDTETT